MNISSEKIISAKLYVPKYEWQWCLNGDWQTIFNSTKAPNAFNRVMQKWLLGIHWRNIRGQE